VNAEVQTPPPLPQAPDQVRWSVPRPIAFIWKFFVGVLFVQSFLFAFVVMGWLWRLSQRFVLKAWWKRSRKISWPDFVRNDLNTAIHESWPNWILGQQPHARLRHRFFGSLWKNLKLGAQAFFNTSVILAPACALWIFSWYDGWNNSFNKGYEQAIVGPATGFAGVFLFIAAMFYLPLAQMRHAATGDWRTFYQFRLVWKFIRRRWLECLGLAMLISALSLPLMVLKTAPGLFTSMTPDKSAPAENGHRKMLPSKFENLSQPEAAKFLKRYYLFCGLYLLPALVLMRLIAARIYASAVIDCVQSGAISEDSLHENEWRALNRLDLLYLRVQPKRNRFVRAIAWVGTKAGAATVGVAMFFVYFTLVAQVYVGEFFHKNDRALGWWNQPLVQLPYFNYTPSHLRSAANEE
jgi:hypothetical protein